jgi:hypothetical protein
MSMLAGRTRRAPAPAVPLAALLLTACTQGPVAWDESAERRLAAPPLSNEALAPDQAADTLVRATLAAALAPVGTGELPAGAAAPAADACPGSLRVARGRPRELVAAWWVERPDRGAVLRAARSADDGRTWDAPVAVDTLDRGGEGCLRPAPSVAVDATNGYVHVAYSLAAPEGKGVFYAHRMDPRAAFEVPQVIVYGDRPAATWVASEGDRVIVAYEDPNTGGRPFISLALSRTGGHTWNERVAASEGSMSAERPVVALRGPRLALGWVERTAPRELASTDDARTATAARPSGVVVRVGTLR